MRLKRDSDAAPIAPPVTCIYRGYGVSWERAGEGVYRAAGVFDAKEPYYTFTGDRWDQPCRF